MQLKIDGRIAGPRTDVQAPRQQDTPSAAVTTARSAGSSDATAGAEALGASQPDNDDATVTRATSASPNRSVIAAAISERREAPAAAPRDRVRTDPDSSPLGPTTSRRALRKNAHEGRRDREIDDLERSIQELERRGARPTRRADTPGNEATLGPSARIAARSSDTDSTLAEKRKQLRETKVLNLLTDTVYALGASQSLVNALDGAVGIDVVDDSKLESDAAFNTTSRRVEVASDLIDDAEKALKELQAQGIVSADGSVIDEERLNTSAQADALVKTATLVGAHEALHGRQHANGITDRSDARREQLVTRRMNSAADVDPSLRIAVRAQAERDAEMQRIRVEEIPAYQVQEQTNLQLGASVRVLVTVDRNGTPLPLEQATENVYALQTGAPLPYGESAGWSRDADEQSTISAQGFVDDERPGRRIPGRRIPGRRIPGFGVD